MRNHAILILAVLAFTATSATAQNAAPTLPSGWVEVSSGEGVRVSVDPSRITERPAGLLRMWTRWDLDRPRALSGKNYARAMRQIELDCAEARMRNLSSAYYSAGGSVVSSYTSTFPEWDPVVPNRVADGILQEVCGYMGKPTG